jgi:hypothetical protein
MVTMRWFCVFRRNVDQGRWPASDPEQALLDCMKKRCGFRDLEEAAERDGLTVEQWRRDYIGIVEILAS